MGRETNVNLGRIAREIAKPRLECFCCLKIESRNQLAVDVRGRWRASQTRSPAMTETSTSRTVQSATCYCETVCTTLLSARVLVTGTFASLTSASSYSGRVWNGALAFICTTL